MTAAGRRQAAAARIDGPGTAEQTWRRWADLRELPEADVLAWPSVAVVAAHPDDEILGAGGTMALLAAAGVRLRLIAVTDGEGSHPHADPAEIGQLRQQESEAALDLLGAGDTEVVRLGLPDTGLADREDELAALLRVHCAGFAACLAPWEEDGHADHEAAGRAARRVCASVLTYPVWMWHWARPDDSGVPWHRAAQVVLPPGIAARKRSAIGAFRSQLTGRRPGLGPVLPPGIVAHFSREQEVLLR